MKRSRKAVLISLAGALYVASLLLPTVDAVWGSSGASPGYVAFAEGWGCIFTRDPWEFGRVVMVIAWLANPAVWLALAAIAAGRWRMASIFSLFAVGAMMQVGVFFWDALIWKPGFWVWLAGGALLAAASSVTTIRERRLEAQGGRVGRGPASAGEIPTLLRPARATAGDGLLRPAGGGDASVVALVRPSAVPGS